MKAKHHHPKLPESLEEWNNRLVDQTKVEIKEFHGKPVAITVYPMGASGRKKKRSVWRRMRIRSTQYPQA